MTRRALFGALLGMVCLRPKVQAEQIKVVIDREAIRRADKLLVDFLVATELKMAGFHAKVESIKADIRRLAERRKGGG